MSKNGAVHGYQHVAMACQGGGSLGAYIVGSLEAMQQAHYEPDTAAGISIGGFTAAIIAGNEPEQRAQKLREFWELISWPELALPGDGIGLLKKWHNLVSSSQGFLLGQPGFFQPRFPSPLTQSGGTPEATSFYDTSLLRETLSAVADFGRINRGQTRLILGATRVRDGMPRWFDSRNEKIGPEHVMASGAMPPGFPGIRIDGELYWDGGCYSNTPLDGLYNGLRDEGDTLCFVIDLFGASGHEPQDISEVSLAMKEIQFSNRIKRNIERIAERHNYAHWFRHILREHREAIDTHPHADEIRRFLNVGRFDFVHVLYQKPSWEVPTCDCEFSKSSIRDRMEQGYDDMKKALEERRNVVERRRTAYELVPAGSVVDTFANGLLVQSSVPAAPALNRAKMGRLPAGIAAIGASVRLSPRSDNRKPLAT